MSSELTGGRYDNFVRRLGNLQGPGSKLTEIVPSAMPVLPVEGQPHELKRLARINTFQNGAITASGAGVSGYLKLRNPVGSGMIVTLRQMIVSFADTSTDWLLGITPVTAGGSTLSTSYVRRDSRCDTSSAANLITQQTTASGNTNAVRSTATGAVTFPLDFTILPGFEFVYEVLVTNKLTWPLLFWEERQAEASELAA